MTALDFTLQPWQNKKFSNRGALATAACAVLSSKYSGNEDVLLHQALLDQPCHDPDQCLLSIAHDSKICTIVDQVDRVACCRNGSKLWQLDVQLPPDYASAPYSTSTQLLIVETDSPTWTWQGLGLLPGGSTPHLLLVVGQSANGAGVNFGLHTYGTPLISATRKQRLFQQLLHVVGQLADSEPSASVSDLSLVSLRDEADIELWSGSPVDPDLDCVHFAIERRAREAPLSEAVCSWDGVMSYAELIRASNRLAKRLTALGVGPEVLVPILFEKSVWAIVAMMSILKAGGAIVPLNPNHPRSRHQAILRDVGASVVVSSELYQDLAHALHRSVMVVSKATLDAPDAGYCATDLSDVGVVPGNPAFAVFTSGSTGQPKGIIIEHAAMCTSVRDHGLVMRFGKHTRTIQFAAYTFDDSFSDIFTTLMFGGCICVPDEHDRLNDLAGSIVRMNANHACLTVTVACQLRPMDVPCLKTMIVGGESVTAQVLQQWADHVYLINSYGPAEASIFCSANSGLSRNGDAINIGVGVGCQLHIAAVEDSNRLVPIGTIGELLIEGPILARGYINNEAKTNASFITDPAWVSRQSGHPSSPRRFYKTGDLARYAEDGTIQVLGRKDTQVKLHGQRIELGEIEHHIRSEVEDCQEVAVELLKVKTSSGAAALPVLVAFLCIPDGNDSDSGMSEPLPPDVTVMSGLPHGAEERLRELLPSYMIPSAFIMVQTMPLMVSGKLDRKQLRAMASHLNMEEVMGHTQDKGHDVMVPEEPRERVLQALWAEVLGIDRTSIHLESSFFHLGGDSVAAMKLVAAARDADVKITVQKIFQHPVLRAQSEVIEFAQPVATDVESVESFSLLKGHDATEILSAAVAAMDLQVDKDEILDVYPCSPLQSGIMALSARNPGSYVAQMAYRLPGELELERFKLAWEAVVRENAILRTRIIQSENSSALWQVVVNDQISWIDYSASSGDLKSYLADDIQAPMTIGSRLSRYAIVHSESEKWFVWTLHHSIFDGESQRLLLRSAERAYHGIRLDPHLEFNAFIKYINEADTNFSAEFWKKQLENSPPPSFPTLAEPDYLPSADQTVSRTVEYGTLQCSDVTISTLIRATWAILLSEYSESHDVIFGSTVSGRSIPLDRVEMTSGPTFATVPIRVAVDKQSSIRDFLALLQQQYANMIPHEQAGLQSIARWIPEARNACNFQSLLVVQPGDHRSGGDSLFGNPETLGSPAGFLTNALTIECRPMAGSLDVQFHFDSRILQISQVERLSRQFEHILQQLNKASSTGTETIKSLELVGDSDIAVLREWNAGSTSEDCVEGLMYQDFYRHLQRQPSSPAVEDYSCSLTYAELDTLSSRLAHSLVARFGAQTGQFVPLCCDKSALAIVAALAIVKTGGALMLLDPALPVDRLKHTVAMAKANFILYSASMAHLASEISIPSVTVDKPSLECLPNLASETFQIAADPSDPACLFLTSGSTGNPKGTVVSHRAWVSGARKHRQCVGMESLRPLRTLQFAGLSFDACLMEIFTTLSLGGCVCVVPDSERTSEGVVRAINRFRVNWAYLSATFASMIDTSSLPTLRTLFFGGEAAPPALFSHYPPHVKLIQGYGPSECTPVTFVNTHLDPKVPGNVGRAIIGSSWLVDPHDHHRLTPIGGLGELLLGGPNVGDGYLGDSTRTARSFIQPPPWSKHFPAIQQGQHMYLTGDLFRYDVDGTMIYAGRKDTQMKLRGQRVELGEIEHRLSMLLPQAKSIVAEGITPAEQDRKILVAFIHIPTFEGDDDVNEAHKRKDSSILLPPSSLDTVDLPTVVTQAAAFLPQYMVPNVFLPILRLPFMAVSRKVDRRALREIASCLDIAALRSYMVHHQEKKLPQSVAEIKLRAAFATVLGLDKLSIGINDSFLLLGGDSIDAMRLIALAKTEGLSLTVGNVLQNPILSDLAQVASPCDHHGSTDAMAVANWDLLKDPNDVHNVRAEAVVQCQLSSKAEIEDAFPCTPLQEGVLALSMAHPSTYSSQHVFVPSTSVDAESFKAAFERIFANLGIFRTRIIQLSSSELVQVIVREELQWAIEDDLDEYLRRDRTVAFSLGGRLGRFALIQSPEFDSPVVVWTAHHSVYDGFSISLITAALEAALGSEWNEVNIAGKADFRQYIRYVCKADLDVSRQYWKDQFTNAKHVEFPSVSGRVSENVEREVVSETVLYSQSPNTVTASSVIRAAWALTIARYTGSPDVVFGATVSGRDAAVPNVLDIIGPVLSTVPVRVTLDPEMTARRYAESIQEQSVQMVGFQHMGLQNIRYCSDEAERACRFQNLLVVQPSAFGKENTLVRHQFGNDRNNTNTHTYPMVIDCDIGQGCINVRAFYDSHKIESIQMKRILRLFGGFIDAVSQATPDITISQLLRSHQPDLHTLYVWNADVPPAVEKCIHEIIPFKAQSSQLAIRSWDGDLTYGELDSLSTKAAHHLVSLGVGPEKMVPLCFRKSLWAVVAVFAVLKAGGAPVFLNAEASLDRLSELIGFLDAEIVLTSAHLFPDAKPVVNCIVEMDQNLVAGITASNIDAPLPELHPHNMAFASFTSGTTGVPKCIVLEHRNVSTVMSLFRTCNEFRPGARVLQFAAYTFDAIIKDIFATTLNGCTLYIPSDEDRMDNIVEYLKRHEITQATLTPTISTLFGPADVPSLELLVLAGEKMSTENVAKWAPALHLNNGYGPSEATGRSSCHSGLKIDSDPSNIGYPFGCICWIVDPNDHDLLVPIGAVGEIVIEGVPVSRGYFKNPDKTTAAFIPPPAWVPADRRHSSNRLYKTGDLAHFNNDGSMTILGRKDAQVKLRGQRIELEESEAAFKRHLPPDINIVVEMVSSKSSGVLLAGFLHDKSIDEGAGKGLQFLEARSTARLADLDLDQICGAVGQKMAAYMLPTVFLAINRIPLLASAKIDRKLLRALYENAEPGFLAASSLSSSSWTRQPPANERQRRLQKIVATVLRQDEASIGLNHSFVQLGGDSITAIRLVSAAKAEKLGLTVAGVLQSATLESLESIATDLHARLEGVLIEPFELLGVNDKSLMVAEVATQCSLTADVIEDVYPCTPLQEALMALSIQQEGDYVALRTFQLPEDIDVAKLQEAWDVVVQRTPILRTRIVETSAGLYQVVVKEHISWSQGDLANVPMGLGTALNGFSISQQHRVLAWASHHATYDGASIPLTLELVDQVYHGKSLDALSTADYRLFIKYIKEQSFETSQSYWASQLADASPESFPGASWDLTGVNASSRMRSVIAPAKTPSSAMVRAAWACVTAAYTSSHDIVFGTISSGRNAPLPDIDRMAGPTIATVPIRVRVDPSEEIEGFLTRLQNEAIDMIPHEHFGLRNIQRISTDIKQACNFQTLLVIHSNQEASEKPWSIFKTEDDSGAFSINTYPLVLEVRLQPEGYTLELSYDQSIIGAVQIKRIISQMNHVISLLSLPRSRAMSTVGDLQVVSAADHADIWKWNDTVPETIQDTLHHLIEQRVRFAPDAEAIVSWDGRMTYKELDQASSTLASEILSRDQSVGSFVALCFEKSLWAVVSMLATLKAGKAFAFLDPSYPVERLRQVTSILNPVLAISSSKHQNLCHELVTNTPVLIAQALCANKKKNAHLTAVLCRPTDPMCAIFTSGTTGAPKGAILSHQAYVTSNTHLAGFLSMTSATRMLHFASYSFDAAIFESMTTLMVGGCVCVPEEQYRNHNIGVEFKRMNVNCAMLTPSFASLLSPEQVPSMKTLVLAGEAATTQLINTWSGKVSLHNVYGPSECSIVSTVNTHLNPSTSPVNIGRASCGALWIVDPNNVDTLVPIGAPGELLLEGPNIGEGYINDPVRTKSTFLERPPSWWSPRNSNSASNVDKFYRTGDIVKYAPDGSIIFVGRKDSQAKIRGQRVEMGDIENHLATIPELGHASVLIPSSGPLRKRLVAVISTHKRASFGDVHQQSSEPRIVSESLHETARSLVAAANAKVSAELPKHMVPNFWVPIESFPVLPSGKLNRKRVLTWLESLDEQSWQQLLSFAETPEDTETLTETENCLRFLWHQVLNLDVGVINSRSAFLQLGGDSISAMQLMSKAREAGLGLTMRDIVKSKTLRELAQVTMPTSSLENGVDAYETEAMDSQSLFELSPIQKLYFDVTPAGNNSFEQSMLLSVTRKVSAATLTDALEKIVQQHPQLRARYTRVSGSWRQSIPRHDPKQPVMRLHQAAATGIPRIVSDSKQRLDLTNGPLFAAELIETESGQYLFLVAHHLSIDLVSWRIILQDLEDLILGRPEALSNKSLSFPAWCALQSRYCQQLNPDRFIQHVEPFEPRYWGIHEGINNTYADLARSSFVLDKSTTSSILRESNMAFGSKPVDIFLAAAITSFGRVFQDRSLPSIFLEGHGREPWNPSIDILRTVGWFTTLFPVSLDACETGDIATAVRSVKDRRNLFSDNGCASFACSQLLPQSAPSVPKWSTAEITLNYLGQYQQLEKDDALFRETGIDLSEGDVSSQERFSLFNISVQVRNGELRFDFSYNRQSLKQHLIARWVAECESCLQEAAVVLPNLSPKRTRSDFPLLQSSHEEVEILLNETLPSLGIDIETVDDIFPCSPCQLDMLQDEENSIGHHMSQINFEITTKSEAVLNPDRLAAAFGVLVKRHQILRTVFAPSGSDPKRPFVQLVLKQFSPTISRTNVSSYSDSKPGYTDAVYKKLHNGEPPYQVTIRHDSAQTAAFLTMDISHALIDGASMAILFRDWNLAYQNQLPSGTAPGYAPLIRLIQDRSPREALSYWTRHLTGLRPSLIPPSVDQSAVCQTSRQQRFLPLRLPDINDLNSFCQRTFTTLPNLIHAVWSIALSMATKSPDVAFGYLVSGRDVPLDGIQDAVGPYFNLLVSRYSVKPTQSFLDVLHAVHATMTERLPHQNFSWPQVSELIPGLPSGAVFNTLINIHRFAPLEGGERNLLSFATRTGYDPLAYDVELNGKIDGSIKLSLVWWSTRATDEWALAFRALIEQIFDKMLLDLNSVVEDLTPQI